MRNHLVVVLLSSLGLVACGGSNQEAKNGGDPWAGFKGTYSTPAAKGETSDDAEPAQKEGKAKAKAEPKHEAAEEAAPAPVLTGHANGVITLNIVEADDAQREARRLAMHEPYRTLLGHFRHELGHYYWERLIEDTPHLAAFRSLFGDEREDYGQALQHHYDAGPPADWRERFISAYASAHPWEDWAECWAHTMHMVSTLDTAANLKLAVIGVDAKREIGADAYRCTDFEALLDTWYPLTEALNALNRSMGLNDPYPFVVNGPTTEKLAFIHAVIRGADR